MDLSLERKSINVEDLMVLSSADMFESFSFKNLQIHVNSILNQKLGSGCDICNDQQISSA